MIFDMAVNVVLYLPFGYLCRQWGWTDRRANGVRLSSGHGSGTLVLHRVRSDLQPGEIPRDGGRRDDVAGALLGAWAVVPKDNEQPFFLLVDTVP